MRTQKRKGKEMAASTKTLRELIEELPPELEKDVRQYVEFLLEKKGKRHGKKLKQNWAGALKEYRSKYTSLELQKKALEWWGD